MRLTRLALSGALLAAAIGAGPVRPAVAADDAKAKEADAGSGSAKKHSKAEIEAMLAKCSDEADAKGLMVTRGKGAERKAFRRVCMRRMGVAPR